MRPSGNLASQPCLENEPVYAGLESAYTKPLELD